MRKYCTIIGLLLVVVLPVCAQNWTPQDSLRLRRLLDGEGEIKLNPEVLKEMGVQEPLGKQQISMEKQWLDFNTTLPEIPNTPKKKVVLTLRPYTATTKYNWDPVYQKKIKIDKDTWRGDPFYELKILRIYSDWAKTPFEKGVRKSMDEIVYHYCSVDTFFNIIRNSSMWLSDIAKSNDYQECIRCREFVNKGMEEYLRNDVEALKAWKTWYENGVYSNFFVNILLIILVNI